jgi:uncharacterized membrane protein YraQ (UPF0718 family)
MKFRGVKLLSIVGLLYLLLLLYDGGRFSEALWKASELFGKLLLIFPVVIVMMALISYYIDPRKIASHLGEESGAKGWMIAMTAGIISHGPMYAWYPMLEDLISHGLKKGLIATFFYARSIKVPLLPIMVAYFGLAFTLILALYILLASLLQGFIIDRICGRDGKCDTEN